MLAKDDLIFPHVWSGLFVVTCQRHVGATFLSGAPAHVFSFGICVNTFFLIFMLILLRATPSLAANIWL